MKTALTIAGSDPTSGAGAQLDIKVFHSIGIHGLSAITALTAQNTKGVFHVIEVKPSDLKKQIDPLLEDFTIEALKTGMLYSPETVELVKETIQRGRIKKVVVDPVTVSSSGAALVVEGTLERMMEKLLPLTTVITPNIYEASLLSGIHIETTDNLYEAATKIKSLGPEVVIITGGHLDIEAKRRIAVDLYYDGESFHRIESEMYQGQYHGTGCAFSASLTAYLCVCESVLEATRRAKEFVSHAIRNAYFPGKGMGLLRV